MPFCLPRPLTSVTVIPEKPFLSSLSRSRWSFSGRIMASIFFISSSHVGAFTMLADVQAHRLFLILDPQTHEGINDLGKGKGDQERVAPDNSNGYDLHHDLMGVASQEAGRANG